MFHAVHVSVEYKNDRKITDISILRVLFISTFISRVCVLLSFWFIKIMIVSSVLSCAVNSELGIVKEFSNSIKQICYILYCQNASFR